MQRRRGMIWLLTGVLFALLAGVLTFRVLAQATATAAEVPQLDITAVVVALQDIPQRTEINESQVGIKEVPTELVPAGAATSLTDVVGKIVTQDVAAGEIILMHRLVEPTVKGRNVVFTMPEDKVIIALPASDLMSRVGFLKPGDRVDLLFSLSVPGQGTDQLYTMDVIQNLEIVGMVMPPLLAKQGDKTKVEARPSTALTNQGVLLFAVSAQDALTIKFLKDSGAIMDIALRAPTSEQRLEAETVDMSYVANRFFPQAVQPGEVAP
ncbi:MAG TPA: Flp pilus assembly protein CpaB [Caldilineae bacterium]|nr:Flp pilus assembly protein CpaB [Caldilineae bacterium]